MARSLTDTSSGIRLEDAPLFIAMQLLGAVAATAAIGWLPRSRAPAS